MEEFNYYKLKDIKKKQEELKKLREESLITYKDCIAEYYRYIDYVAFLVESLGIPNNEINNAIILGNLIKMGTFSETDEFVLENDNDEIKGCPGISIIKGIGTDYNMSYFCRDVFKALNMVCGPFYVRKSTKDDRDCAYGELTINLMGHSDNIYGYNLAENRIYACIHDEYMKELFRPGFNYLVYDAKRDMIERNVGEELAKIVEFVMNSYKDKPIMREDEYKAIHNTAMKAVDNPRLFDDFKLSSKKYIKRITDNLR